MIEILKLVDITKTDRAILSKFQVGDKYIRGLTERRHLKSRGLHGEGADADFALQMPSTITRLEKVMLVIANYPPCNVYNMDETGLYYRCLPNRSYIFTDKKRKGV